MNPAPLAQQSLMASGFSISRGGSIIIRPEGGKEKENGLRSEERFPFLICGGRPYPCREEEHGILFGESFISPSPMYTI